MRTPEMHEAAEASRRRMDELEAMVAEISELRAQRDRMQRKSTRAVEISRFLAEKARWSRRTFGDGPRTKGILAHISKELAEIMADPLDLEEWIDVFMLATDGYWRAWVARNPERSGDMEQMAQDFIDGIRAKHAKNEARQWPAAKSQDEPVEHVR